MPPKLEQYQCHKRVLAGKITAIIQARDGDTGEAVETAHLVIEGQDTSIPIPRWWVKQKLAEVGGYYVHYDDGYVSYSPAKAFEEGYKLVGSEGMPIEDPLEIELFSQTKNLDGSWGDKQRVRVVWDRGLHPLHLKLMLAEVLRGNLRTESSPGHTLGPNGFSFEPGDDVTKPAAVAIEAFARGYAADNGMRLTGAVRRVLAAFDDWDSDDVPSIAKFGEAIGRLRLDYEPFVHLFESAELPGESMKVPAGVFDLSERRGKEIAAPAGSHELLERAARPAAVPSSLTVEATYDEPCAGPMEGHHSTKMPLSCKTHMCGCWDEDVSGRAFSLRDPKPSDPQSDFVSDSRIRHFCAGHWAERGQA
jgi:hypothetical protein